jgi:sugar-phosphatase
MVPMEPADIEGVLFDMDGTLVDSDGAVVRAWHTWSAEYDVDVDLIMAGVHGSPAENTVRRVRPDLADTEQRAAADRQLELQYDDLSDVIAAPGAHELLAWLARRDLPWAVVTSADQKLAAARLGAAEIEVPVLVTVEDVIHGKPHPEGYIEAARRLGIEPARCLVVEDSAPGIEAGRAAGCRVAALRGLDGELPISDLRQLARWFGRVG